MSNEPNQTSNQTNAKNVPDTSGYELKMPKESSLASDPTVRSVPFLPIIIGLVIALLLILGGLFLWSSDFIDSVLEPNLEDVPQATRPTREANNEPESTTAEAQEDTAAAVSTSDEISAIRADLESTQIDTLDADMTAIEAELGL